MFDSTVGKVFHDGDVIVREGSSGENMYVVLDGRAEVLTGPEGSESRIAVLETGDFFGEMALFDREVRSASVRALGEVRMLTVDRRTLLGRIHEDPSLAFKMLEKMSERVRTLDALVAQLSPGGSEH